jgi:uncharacterized protein YkwD
MAYNYVDIFLIFLLLLSTMRGLQQGFLLALLDVVRWIGSILLGLRYYQSVAGWLHARVDWSETWMLPLAFILTVIGASILINLIGQVLMILLPRAVHRQPGNRLLGIVPGFINGLIVAAITAALLFALPLPDSVRAATRESSVANRLAPYIERLEDELTPVFGNAITQTLNTLTIRPQSDESVPLSCTISYAPPVPELETQMLDLVNQERSAAGLEPLSPDPELTQVARQHSADMLARGYFAHNTPEGRTPFDRIAAANIPFRTAGENLALAPTLSLAHTGLMNSPGHRANILRPEFGRLGIGILDGGHCGLMVTQNFRD